MARPVGLAKTRAGSLCSAPEYLMISGASHFSAALTRRDQAMQLPQTGGCQCGKIRYEITEAPQLVYTCHCTDCQRLTSSAFSIGIVVPEAGFRLAAGEPRALQ